MTRQFNFFVGKSSDIIRVLLVNYPKTWTIRALSKEANVSLGWTSKVANSLMKEKFVIKESGRAELKLMAPSELLKKWATYNNFMVNTQFFDYYSIEQDITRFLGKFNNVNGPDYALTGLAGAALVHPFVRPTDVFMYVKSEKDVKKWSELLQLMPVEKQGNIHFSLPESNGIFYGLQEKNGIKIVSDVQLYVDLLNYPGRGLEAAEPIINHITKNWREMENLNVQQRNYRSL
jgi:hypothetical protein